MRTARCRGPADTSNVRASPRDSLETAVIASLGGDGPPPTAGGPRSNAQVSFRSSDLELCRKSIRSTMPAHDPSQTRSSPGHRRAARHAGLGPAGDPEAEIIQAAHRAGPRHGQAGPRSEPADRRGIHEEDQGVHDRDRSSCRRSSTTCRRRRRVPTPKAVLGDIAGAPGKLPYSKEVYDYMRLLAKSTPRVKVYSIGTTEEGREMIAVAVASEALMAKLDANKADLAKLADPRTIKMDDALADEIAQARRAGLLHHRHDPLDRGRRADGADGARLSPRGRRQPVHPQHPRPRHHADHADRRSRRPRPRRRRLRVAEEAPERHADEPALLGQLRRARQQPRRDGADAQALAERAQHLPRTGRRRCCTICTSRGRSSTTTRSATAPTTRGSIRS